MDGTFGLVAYEASDDEAQTSSGPSDNGGGGVHSMMRRTEGSPTSLRTSGVVLLTEPANGNAATPTNADEAHSEEMPDAAPDEAADALQAEARALQALQDILPPDIWNPPEGDCDPALQVCMKSAGFKDARQPPT